VKQGPYQGPKRSSEFLLVIVLQHKNNFDQWLTLKLLVGLMILLALPYKKIFQHNTVSFKHNVALTHE